MKLKNIVTCLSLSLLLNTSLTHAEPVPSMIEKDISVAGATADIYITSKDTDKRLAKGKKLKFKKSVQPTEPEISVYVNPRQQFQTFFGIGGAITDASAETFYKLPKKKQKELIRAYYDPKKGLGYTIARTHIHSVDFSSASYTYIEEGDKKLKTFDIEPDRKYRIPMIKEAIKAAGGLTMYVSPWSPPAFMKSSNKMVGGGKLLPEYYESWARYYAKFIKAYEKEGIPIWGLTIQNEPMATQRWESSIYTAEEERDFLKNYLGPILAREGLGDKKIIVWDHNRDLMAHRAHTIMSDPAAARYVWGIGYHWYEPWTGSDPMHANLRNIYESYPDLNILFTEGTVENFSRDKYQYWGNAERYGSMMINDFNVGNTGWTDWNILLDQNGGPNHVQNFCFAPIHGDTETGELIYTPTYYYLGHFSKFIKPGARRVSTSTTQSFLLATTFMNQDGSLATVVMNQNDDAKTYHFHVDNQQSTLEIPAHSIQTIVYGLNIK